MSDTPPQPDSENFIASDTKMHPEEYNINIALVKHLICSQFPDWADLSIQRFRSMGTDNAIYCLGNALSIRLPLTASAAGRIDKEHQWLPTLAPLLPLTIPTPLAKGMPTADYPAYWSIYPWLEGETATITGIKNPHQAATQLAEFINALQKVDTQGGPLPGEHNFFRGVPLIDRDAKVRESIAALQGLIDTDAAIAGWENTLATSVWQGSPVWIHGDLLPGNLLLNQGQFSAVIDFGGMGIGDPACDLITAWCLFSAETRAIFRRNLMIDDATWVRGRGWALSIGLIALPYYRQTNPVFAEVAAHMINEALLDHKK